MESFGCVPTGDGFFVVHIWERRVRTIRPTGESNAPLGAQLFYFAMGAVRLAGVAPLSAVSNQKMGDQCPILLGNESNECALHFHGIEMPRQPHPARKATHMGIHDNSLRQPKSVP